MSFASTLPPSTAGPEFPPKGAPTDEPPAERATVANRGLRTGTESNGCANRISPPRETADPFAAFRSTTVPATTFFESDRLWFRGVSEEDVPRLNAWRNDPRVRLTTSPVFPTSLEATRQWVKERNPYQPNQPNDHSVLVFGLKSSDEVIGSTGLFGINWIDRIAEWGIGIDPAHWSQGYGREVARRVLAYGFDELNLHRIELRVLDFNHRGIKAYTSAGFVHEGTRRQAAFVQGRHVDIHIMAALRETWR